MTIYEPPDINWPIVRRLRSSERLPTLEEIVEAGAMEAMELGSYRLPLDYTRLNYLEEGKFPYQREVQQILSRDPNSQIHKSQYPHRNLSRAVVVLLKRNQIYNSILILEVSEEKGPDDITSTPIAFTIHRRDRVTVKISNPPDDAYSFNSGLFAGRKPRHIL